MSLKKNMFSALLLIFIVTQAGCGKKIWPEPNTQKQEFTWQNIKYTWQDDCLQVKAQIKGNVINLEQVALEQEFEGNCPQCPFLTQKRIVLPVPSDQAILQNGTLSLQICRQWTSKIFRWRLVGYNRYIQVRPQISTVFNSTILNLEIKN